ncbi:hypothetical protein [Peribacillus sp. Bi134]|uniref:hypothetical protein n=1 Tax=Peribacillus sp. Bi134 TaxID=2884272 RepID=UPI001E4FDE6E|nr:hypothetical protein [Peribacillus sp. Bi134]
MPEEEVIRLTPTPNTLRELFLKSGNQCAFPGCFARMIDNDGNFIGQVCHIEAAMPGGERFNSDMTNDDRRQFSNLMLMCYEHHKVTDNVGVYPVERLKAMKQAHENKFADIVSKLEQSVEDLTAFQISHSPIKLLRINEVLDWGSSEEELLESLDEVNQWVKKLKKLTPDTRKIFVIMIERSIDKRICTVTPLDEVKSITRLGFEEYRNHLIILHRYGFISEAFEDDEGFISELNKFDSGWPFWDDLLKFTQKTSYSLDEIIVNLNFSVLG